MATKHDIMARARERGREVLRLRAEGQTFRAIAEHLGVSYARAQQLHAAALWAAARDAEAESPAAQVARL